MTRKLTDKEQRIKDIQDAADAIKKDFATQYLNSFPVIRWQHRTNPYPGFNNEYQQPERDEQGTFYGYKVLLWHEGIFRSPQYPVKWNPGGSLEADQVPTTANKNGIYAVKRMNHSDLRFYMGKHSQCHGYYRYEYSTPVIVHIALSGVVIETEQGFRAEKAQIIEILDEQRGWMSYEHWRDYQNSQRSPRRDSRYFTEERYPFNPD